MAISLYDISVGSYLQVLPGTLAVLQKGAVHCEEKGIAPADIVATSLYPDMANFHFQIATIVHQSVGAISALQSEEFGPPKDIPDMDYAGLQTHVADALAQLTAMTPDSVNKFEGGKVIFKLGEMEIPFTAANFILSFSLPNLYFHTTTAYDILRSKGVPIGKIDFLGAMRAGL